MNRDNLIAKAKNEYERLAAAKNLLRQSDANINLDMYYDNLLGAAQSDIRPEPRDSRKPGNEITETTANNKGLSTEWTLNDPRR